MLGERCRTFLGEVVEVLGQKDRARACRAHSYVHACSNVNVHCACEYGHTRTYVHVGRA